MQTAARTRTVLIHELQHAIQYRHNFQGGDNYTTYMPTDYDKTTKIIKEHADSASTYLLPKLKDFKNVNDIMAEKIIQKNNLRNL